MADPYSDDTKKLDVPKKPKTLAEQLAGTVGMTPQDKLRVYDILYWQEQQRRQNALEILLNGEGSITYDPKEDKFYTSKSGLRIEVSEGIPERLARARTDLYAAQQNLDLLKEYYNQIDDKVRQPPSSSGAAYISPEDQAIARYTSLASAMLNLYREQQTYNNNQMKEQRERIKFAREQGIEPWFNNTPAPLGRNYAAPLEQETVEQAQALAPFSKLAGAYQAAASAVYPGFAKGTGTPKRLSAMIRKKGNAKPAC